MMNDCHEQRCAAFPTLNDSDTNGNCNQPSEWKWLQHWKWLRRWESWWMMAMHVEEATKKGLERKEVDVGAKLPLIFNKLIQSDSHSHIFLQDFLRPSQGSGWTWPIEIFHPPFDTCGRCKSQMGTRLAIKTTFSIRMPTCLSTALCLVVINLTDS